MANKYAQPSAANWDWTNVNNWSLTDGGATGAAAPVDGDTVILKNAYSPSSNLSNPTIQLTALYIMPGYGGTASGVTLGTNAAPLEIDATNVYIINERCSFIKLSGFYTNVFARALGGATLYLTAGSLAGEVTNFYGGPTGFVDIGDDMEMSTFRSAGMSGLIRADSTSAVDLELNVCKGASVDCWRKVSTGTIDGKLQLSYAASIAAGSGTATVKVASGGTLDIRSSGALNQVELMSRGTLLANQTPGFLTAPTLSTLILHDGHVKNIPTSALTVTTTVEAGGYGATNQSAA